MQSWDDDAAVFYERSLGDIVNGADLPAGATSRRTGALYVASNLPATPVTADDGGWVAVRYGEDGNALAVTVHGQCGDPLANGLAADCRPSGTSDPTEAIALSCAYSCAVEQHFTYAWDEVNRIAHARRFDRDRTSGPADWQLAVEQRYLSDASNQRTVKTTTFRGVESGAERTALYVYPGNFERRGLQTTLDRTSYEAISGDTETQYGVGGARIVWRTGTRDDGLDRDQRITIALTDLIQSTTAVIDLATGELVEAGSYYANGARETYRSNDSETVAPEPMGFTGKEADEEVGLTYFGHRYLMARLGRWASPDPLQTHAVGGGEAVNGYHYVSGNVLQARDPLGLEGHVALLTVEGTTANPATGEPMGSGTLVEEPNPDAAERAFLQTQYSRVERDLQDTARDYNNRLAARFDATNPDLANFLRALGEREAGAITVDRFGQIHVAKIFGPAALSPDPRFQVNLPGTDIFGESAYFRALYTVINDPTRHVAVGIVQTSAFDAAAQGQDTPNPIVALSDTPYASEAQTIGRRRAALVHEFALHIEPQYGSGHHQSTAPSHGTAITSRDGASRSQVTEDNDTDAMEHGLLRLFDQRVSGHPGQRVADPWEMEFPR